MNKDKLFWFDAALYTVIAGIVTAQTFEWPKGVAITLAIVGAMCNALKAKLSGGVAQPAITEEKAE